MTFRIANNQIHIGWGQTLTVLVTIVTGVWRITAGYDDWVQKAQKTNDKLTAIERTLSLKSTTDSIQTSGISSLFRKFDSLSFSGHHIETQKPRTAMRFYTEKRVNGHLILTEVKQD